MIKLVPLTFLLLLMNPVMSAVLTFDCEYRLASDINQAHYNNNLLFLRFQVDSQTYQSFALDQQGMHEIDVHQGTKGLTFIEKTSSGAVHTTTITQHLESVHSHHSILDGLMPTQYFGQCSYTRN